MAIPVSPAKTAASRSAYLVLGMHRSGTSAVTQLLALAGAKLPSHVMPGDEHNAQGYFEPWRIAIFNDERLRAADSAWDDPLTNPASFPADDSDWRDRAIKLLRSEYGRAKHPLLKDPRVSVLLPLWRYVLESQDMTARCVIPVRHPLAVAGSLAKRDGFPIQKSILLWMTYMVETELGTRDLPRAFVEYDALLADWRPVVASMETALGATLPNLTLKAQAAVDAFLTSELRHNAGGETLSTYGDIGAAAEGVYDWLIAKARGEAPSPALMEAGHDLIKRLRHEVGALISPVTRSNNQALSALGDARAALTFAQSQADELRSNIDALQSHLHQAHATNAQLNDQVESLSQQLLQKIDERREIEGTLDALLAAR